MLKLSDETYHQMELEEYFEEDVKPNLFAVSRVFAEARKQMSLSEYKAFTFALASISWKDTFPETLYLNKKDIAKIVGINSDPDHLSQDLKRSIGDMPAHSYLRFSEKDSGTWVNGNFVNTIAMFKNYVRIRMNPDFLGLFGNLDKNYITMWSGDIYKMKSERTIKFYELLRENSDTRKAENIGTVGIKQFKELFDIPKDGEGSYMRKNGHFDRTSFERFVIDAVCEDLSHAEMIKLTVQPNGKYYEKIKQGNRVIAYKFFWTISKFPRIASAEDVREINQNPVTLKIAKDIQEGKKKVAEGRGKDNKLAFNNNFQQREYDYNKLERELILAQEIESMAPSDDGIAPDPDDNEAQ